MQRVPISGEAGSRSDAGMSISWMMRNLRMVPQSDIPTEHFHNYRAQKRRPSRHNSRSIFRTKQILRSPFSDSTVVVRLSVYRVPSWIQQPRGYCVMSASVCSGRLGASARVRAVGLKDVYGSTNRKRVMQYRTSFEWCSSREHIVHNCSWTHADYSSCALAKFFDRNVWWECHFNLEMREHNTSIQKQRKFQKSCVQLYQERVYIETVLNG